MICIYHSRDLDGWMSAAIVELSDPHVKLLGWDYGQAIPTLPEGEDITMVDVSFPKDVMYNLAKNNGLTWIDHHVSAIKENADIPNLLHGKQDVHKAACELTWEYFFPDSEMPELVRLLGRYDCFGHKGTEEERKVLEFQYGARQIINSPETALINLKMAATSREFDIYTCSPILKDGQAIYAYLCTEAKQVYKRIFPIGLDGYKFACVNQERFNPINFNIDYHKDGYDGFACFHYQDGRFNYSLYNDNGNVDCSVIAKARGGGGHRGASGFRSDNILLK